jgi:hypothetical protein
MAANGDLAGGRALARWMQTDAISGSLVQKIILAVNNMGRNAGVSPTGQLVAPVQPNALSIKASGGYVHAQITDNNPVNKGVHYFLEADTTATLSRPIVVAMGPSRTSHPFPLPAFDDNGNAQNWHFQCYAQYPGSQPSAKTVFGGQSGATPVSVGGTTNMTLLPSNGSGTASPTGSQGGSGFGKVSARPAVGPKRSVGA